MIRFIFFVRNYLDQHRTQCEAEGRYVEAEMAKNRIEEVKHQQYTKVMEELQFTQQQAREECEATHIKQYEQFNLRWD